MASSLFPDDHRGHELWSARVQQQPGEQGLLVDHAVVMCSRCGCYAFNRVQELGFSCRGTSVMSGSRLARWKRFTSCTFPKHGVELRLDQATRCTATAYAFLARRWLRRCPGEPGFVPDSGIDAYGMEERRRAIVATLVPHSRMRSTSEKVPGTPRSWPNRGKRAVEIVGSTVRTATSGFALRRSPFFRPPLEV